MKPLTKYELKTKVHVEGHSPHVLLTIDELSLQLLQSMVYHMQKQIIALQNDHIAVFNIVDKYTRI